MITVPGRLAVKTVPSINGPFNVGKLFTSFGQFVIKCAELEQYEEGKYDGQFNIDEIRSSMYTTNGRIVVEVRAYTAGWELDNVDQLSKDESHNLSPQESPAEEEAKAPAAAPAIPATESAPIQASTEDKTATAAIEQTSGSSNESTSASEPNPDAELFGTLWPLATLVKLDATLDRRQLRKQRDRLDALGYEFNPLKQDWFLKAA